MHLPPFDRRRAQAARGARPASPTPATCDRRDVLQGLGAAAILLTHPDALLDARHRGSGLRDGPSRLLGELELESAAPLEELARFYGGALQLPLIHSGSRRLTVRVGSSLLTFLPASDRQRRPFYHVAFNVPEHQLLAARAWQLARTPLITAPERLKDPDMPADVVHFRHWNAHSVFFWDPAGNLLEHIARHDAPLAAEPRFGPASLLAASEIGLVCDDVPSAADALRARLALPHYGAPGDAFTALGDEGGLVLAMQEGRVMGFDEGKPNGIFPTRVQLRGGRTASVALAGHPYSVAMSDLAAPAPIDARRRQLALEVSTGNIDWVRATLTNEPELAATRDDHGCSLLVLAFVAGDEPMGREIARHLAELDLVEAILVDDAERIAARAEAEAEHINALRPIGLTPYGVAARWQRKGAMWPLNRFGGDPNVAPLTGSGRTALVEVFSGRAADPRATVDAALRMLTDAADPRLAQPGGDSALHAAARLGHPGLVEVMLRLGADPEARDEDGARPLEHALRAARHEAAALLRGTDAIARSVALTRRRLDGAGRPYVAPETEGVAQLTVNELVEACHYDFEHALTVLARDPRALHACASWDELTVEAAAHMGRADWVEALLERGAPVSLPTAVMLGRRDMVATLLDLAPEAVHERGPHDFPLVWYPEIGGGDLALTELLLARGVPIEQEKMGVTLLHRAAYRGMDELVAFLLERGAPRDSVGWSDFSPLRGTPLDFAEARAKTRSAELLRARGARRSSELKQGEGGNWAQHGP